MDHVDDDNARRGNRLDRHVAARALPLVVLVGEHRADEPNENARMSSAAPDSRRAASGNLSSSEQIGRHLVWSSQLRLGALQVTGARGMSWPREPMPARARFFTQRAAGCMQCRISPT